MFLSSLQISCLGFFAYPCQSGRTLHLEGEICLPSLLSFASRWVKIYTSDKKHCCSWLNSGPLFWAEVWERVCSCFWRAKHAKPQVSCERAQSLERWRLSSPRRIWQIGLTRNVAFPWRNRFWTWYSSESWLLLFACSGRLWVTGYTDNLQETSGCRTLSLTKTLKYLNYLQTSFSGQTADH